MEKHSLIFNQLFKFIVTALILAIPLYPKFPFLSIPGSSVAVRLEDFLMLITFLVTLVYYFPQLRLFFKEPIHKSIMLYLIAGLIALLSAMLVTKTIIPQVGILHYVRRIEYFVPFFFGYLYIKHNKSDIDYIVKLLIITAAIAFIYGIGQRYFNWPIIITQNSEYAKGVALRYTPSSHLNSTFAGHYDMATFLVLILPVLVSSLFLVKDKFSKFSLAAAFIGGLWLLVNSASRISLVSYLVAVTTGLLLVKKYQAIPFVIILSMGFIFFSTNLQERYTHLFDVITKRLNGTVSYLNIPQVYAAGEEIRIGGVAPSPSPTPIPIVEDRSSSIRFNIEWPRAVNALKKNPLLGTGYSSITLATDNDYLRLLGETGLVGFAAFSLILMSILYFVLSYFPFTEKLQGLELGFTAGIISSYPGIFLNALFIDVFEASKFAIIFWLLTGILVGLLYEKNQIVLKKN